MIAYMRKEGTHIWPRFNFVYNTYTIATSNVSTIFNHNQYKKCKKSKSNYCTLSEYYELLGEFNTIGEFRIYFKENYPEYCL